ncbi:hypothetical protein Tco_0478715 [Tanacetum coccineum]
MGLLATHPNQGTDVKYQVDKTQSTIFEMIVRMLCLKLEKRRMKTSNKPIKKKLNLQNLPRNHPLKYLLKSLSPLNINVPESSHAKESINTSNSESSSYSKTFRPYDNFVTVTERVLHEEVVAFYADLRSVIEEYVDDNVDHRTQINAAIKPWITLTRSTHQEPHYKRWLKPPTPPLSSLIALSTQCASISESLKEDHTFNQRLLKVTMQADISSIKGMVTEMFQVFNSFSTTTPLAHLDKEEKLEKTRKEARLLEMNKSESIKVVHEEAKEVVVDLKELQSSKGG